MGALSDESLARLRKIADELRELAPQLVEGVWPGLDCWRHIDAAIGELIQEANSLGAFSQAGYAGLRAVLKAEGKRGTEDCSFPASAHLLARECCDKKDWPGACRKIADTIETEAAQLHSEQGDGNGGAGSGRADQDERRNMATLVKLIAQFQSAARFYYDLAFRNGRDLPDLQNESDTFAAMNRLVEVGKVLAVELERAGKDSTELHGLLDTAFMGLGRDRYLPAWESVRVSLARIATACAAVLPPAAKPKQPEENVSERLPRTEADADLLKPVIVKLLQTIPKSWAEFNLDALTAIEDNALFLLMAAGMVERRGWLRSTIANHPTCFEVRFQATGECGFGKAIEHLTAVEYATWGDAWQAWKAGETGHVSPFRIETIKPQEWRLTADGVIARSELDGSNRTVGFDNVLDFIFKRGFFGPGYWGRLAPQRVDPEIIEEQTRLTGQDWASLTRPPLSGSGAVVELRKIDKPAKPQAVNLVNWQDGADAFAAAFAAMFGPAFEAMSKGQVSSGVPPTPTAPPPTTAPKHRESLLTATKWGDLGIGIDEEGRYLAYSPCPIYGSVFPVENAVVLDLRGDRWKELLDMLARSGNGNTADKQELMQRLGYLKGGRVATEDLSELKNDKGGMNELKTAQARLTQAMADLGRELRQQIKGPEGKGAPRVLSVAMEGKVQAAFVVRHLLRGPDGKLRFGQVG
jgi:hypothetical protein